VIGIGSKRPHLNLEGRIGIGRPRMFVCTFAQKNPRVGTTWNRTQKQTIPITFQTKNLPEGIRLPTIFQLKIRSSHVGREKPPNTYTTLIQQHCSTVTMTATWAKSCNCALAWKFGPSKSVCTRSPIKFTLKNILCHLQLCSKDSLLYSTVCYNHPSLYLTFKSTNIYFT
jgi:hypothetical protein